MDGWHRNALGGRWGSQGRQRQNRGDVRTVYTVQGGIFKEKRRRRHNLILIKTGWCIKNSAGNEKFNPVQFQFLRAVKISLLQNLR